MPKKTKAPSPTPSPDQAPKPNTPQRKNTTVTDAKKVATSSTKAVRKTIPAPRRAKENIAPSVTAPVTEGPTSAPTNQESSDKSRPEARNPTASSHSTVRPPANDFRGLISAASARYSQRFEIPYARDHVATGYTNLELTIGHLHRGDLITLASHTGLGKSLFALNLIWNIGGKDKHPVLLFDFQAGSAVWVDRLLARLSRISVKCIRRGQLADADWVRMTGAINQTYDAPIVIEEDRDITLAEMRERVLSAIQEHGKLGLIVVDSLDTLRWPTKVESRAEERSLIASWLKSLARDAHTPLLALCHVPDRLEDKVFQPARLADVGQGTLLTAESDIVLLLHEHRATHSSGILHEGEVAVRVEAAKHRNAKPRSVSFAFHLNFGYFTELPQEVGD